MSQPTYPTAEGLNPHSDITPQNRLFNSKTNPPTNNNELPVGNRTKMESKEYNDARKSSDNMTHVVEEGDVPKAGATEIEILAANIDRAAEKRLVRKMDFALLPVLAIVYLFNSLDRANLANAQTDGMDKDIGLVGNQYYLIVTIFYVPLCLFGTPLSMLAKRYSAARVIPLMMIGFGSCCICTAAVKNFGSLFAVRFILGICESPMLPSIVFYLSQWYKRGELARRIGVYYAAAAISGAFSGLLAFAIFQIQHSYLRGWQLLFLIEGAGTLVFAVFAFFWLPRSPATCWFFTPEEKELARIRILTDGTNEIDEKIDWKDAFRPFIQDWHYIVWAFLALGLGVPLASVNNFLPQIIARFRLSVTTTNLYTVAPNVCGTIFLILFTQSSDYFRERSLHIVIPLLITMVGFIILGTIDVLANLGVAYFACFLLCMGASTPSVLLATWYSNNSISESKRVVLTGVMVGIANSAGLISGNVFQAKDAPVYTPALATSAAFGGFTAMLALGFGLYMRIENRRRNAKQGLPRGHGSKDVPTELLGKGPSAPEFRYVY